MTFERSSPVDIAWYCVHIISYGSIKLVIVTTHYILHTCVCFVDIIDLVFLQCSIGPPPAGCVYKYPALRKVCKLLATDWWVTLVTRVTSKTDH